MAQGKSNNNIIYYTTTLQSAAAATGNGTAVNCKGIGSLAIQVSGTFVGTVLFEATIDDTNWIGIEGSNLNTSAKATSATATGLFRFDTSQLSQFRARISAYTSGSITVKGISSELPMGGAPEASTVASVQGQAADDAAKSGNPVQVGGIYSTTPATRTNGDMVAWEMTATGAGTVSLTGREIESTTLVDALAITDTNTRTVAITNLTKYKDWELIITNTHNQPLKVGFTAGGAAYRLFMTDGTVVAMNAAAAGGTYYTIPADALGGVPLSLAPLTVAGGLTASSVTQWKKLYTALTLQYSFASAPASGALTVSLRGLIN